jgi:hypothetical protein
MVTGQSVYFIVFPMQLNHDMPPSVNHGFENSEDGSPVSLGNSR